MKVVVSSWVLAAAAMFCGSVPALGADVPCTCPDMMDLAGRSDQAQAAIRAYRERLAAWTAAGGAPAADDEGRVAFQLEVEETMTAAKDPRANTAAARTNRLCRTTVDPTTSCLNALLLKHESVHAAACEADPSRWATLADYAREEITAYEAEREFIEAGLAKLERDCRFTLEFDSTIAGATEATRSDAKTKVDLTVHFPRGLVSRGFTGSHPLNYDTRDVGPPKLVGDPMLVKLAKPCYAASKGSGNVSFEVHNAWLYRERTPPFLPKLDLPIFVGDTTETRYLKGPRGCPRDSEPRAFWSEQFKLGKNIVQTPPAELRDSAPTASDLAIVIESWTFSSEDEAEKTIQTECLGFGGMDLPGFGVVPGGGVMCEKTVLKFKRKR
ncbi:MAG TPA: hypothetical protein VJS12_01045 [Steroidobacteraceae bacterium]|nr:hypothetical protein [Steroidobacteraceae bacterium]